MSGASQAQAMIGAAAQALSGGQAILARDLFEQATALAPADPGSWLGLAMACRALGDEAGLTAALDRTLALDPAHLPGLMMKADHFAQLGDDRAAAAFYRAAVARAPPLRALPAHLRGEVERAERLGAHYAETFEAQLRAAVAQAGFDPARSSRRFALAMELLLGKKQVFVQAPSAFYFPELPQRQFYERAEFPWMAAVEARTDEIRAELLALAPQDRGFRPYVRSTGERPPKSFGRLLDSLDWTAFFLIEDGEVVAEAAERCPATLEALAAAPLSRTPGRTPSVLFSLLRPGAHIPPHTGLINTRLICHLPLIVPPGCALRVGNQTREWVEGQCLIFDDTIEHEAWNRSDALRAVLLFDIWRPELALEEQALVSALLSAVAFPADSH